MNIGGGLWFFVGFGFPSVFVSFASMPYRLRVSVLFSGGEVLCWAISFSCAVSYFLPFVVDVVLCSLFFLACRYWSLFLLSDLFPLRLLCVVCDFIVALLFVTLLFRFRTCHWYFTVALRYRVLILALADNTRCTRVSVSAWATPVPSGFTDSYLSHFTIALHWCVTVALHYSTAACIFPSLGSWRRVMSWLPVLALLFLLCTTLTLVFYFALLWLLCFTLHCFDTCLVTLATSYRTSLGLSVPSGLCVYDTRP